MQMYHGESYGDVVIGTKCAVGQGEIHMGAQSKEYRSHATSLSFGPDLTFPYCLRRFLRVPDEPIQ